MSEWLWFFIPLWTLGFLIGFYIQRINEVFFEEPKAFVLKEKSRND